MESSRTRRAAAALLVLAFVLPQPSRAAAQDGGLSLRLLRQPLWYSDADDLGLVLRIDNRTEEDLEGFSLRVLAYERVASRIELRESFDERPEILRDGEDHFFLRTNVPPGGSRAVTLRTPLSTLGFSEDDASGVYPLEISLEGAPPEEPLDSLMTQVIFYPHSPDIPLDLVLVWPLSAVPARGPDGLFHADPLTGRFPLEEAVAGDGWLTRLLAELGRRPRLKMGLAPTPRLIEELGDMAGGYSRATGRRSVQMRPDSLPARHAVEALDALREVLGDGRGVEPLLMPYSAPDLPLTATGPGVLRQRQWREGADVLHEVLDIRVAPGVDGTWLYPPGGRLDAAALELLQRDHAPLDGPLKTFFSAESIEQARDPSLAGCPRAPVTFACPVRTRTVEGAVRGFVVDPGLQESFTRLADAVTDRRLLLQRLLAETAMIREEFPALEGRVVHLAVPTLWRPPARLLRLFLNGLEAPWLRTRSPSEGLRAADEVAPRRVVERAVTLRAAPPASYLAEVRRAAAEIESFSTIEPPAGAVERLRRDVLVAESRLWWIEDSLLYLGQAYAREAQEEAQRYLRKIKVGGRDSITLTSRRQDIPLVLFNENPFLVRVRVQLRSASLDFIGDWERGRQVPVPPGNQPLTIQATARQSGEFPLEVRLTTGDQRLITQEFVRIRSTQFNRIALGITFGALAFLILFYAARSLKRHRNKEGLGTTGSTPA